ncbi:MAG: polymer-forming cytoskeletal protein [Halobacteriales archaeon]|nr:polymer-forming cytoskeletal protein [Halobacteriales archaeon]
MPLDWSSTHTRTAVTAAVVVIVVVGMVPGIAMAQPSRTGGTVVVAADETVDGLQASAGTVIIRGTVDGDLRAFAGNVFIEGNVTGDVEAFAGNVRVAGTIDGDLQVFGGNLLVEPSGRIGGTLEAGVGSLTIAGTVGDTVRADSGSITLAPTARIDGDVVYAGELTDEGATVTGSVIRDQDLELGGQPSVPSVPGWIFGVYGGLVTLAVGLVLLLAFPDFSSHVADRALDQPARTAGIGLLVLLGVPIGMVIVMLTLVGIPLAIAGFLVFGLGLWIGSVYGRFAVGVWILSLLDRHHRWVALLVGVLVVGLLTRIPWIGGLFDFVVVLLGFGALGRELYRAYHTRRDDRTDADGFQFGTNRG